MRDVRSSIKEWGAAILAVGAVLLTAVYAVTKESRAAESIRHTNHLACALSEAATTVGEITLSPGQIEDLKSRRDDLRKRMEDTGRPGCIAAELTETARKNGLIVGGIQPMDDSQQAPGSPAKSPTPRYRIVVEGAYREIGEYMDACRGQRLPARVRQFRVAPVKSEDGVEQKTLRAEIVIETFQPRERAAKGGDSKQ